MNKTWSCYVCFIFRYFSIQMSVLPERMKYSCKTRLQNIINWNGCISDATWAPYWKSLLNRTRPSARLSRSSDPQLGLFGARGRCFTKMSSIQPGVKLGNQCNPLTAYITFSRAVFCKNSFYTVSNNYLPTILPYVLFPSIIGGFGHLPKSITNNKHNEKYTSNYKVWP